MLLVSQQYYSQLADRSVDETLELTAEIGVFIGVSNTGGKKGAEIYDHGRRDKTHT